MRREAPNGMKETSREIWETSREIDGDDNMRKCELIWKIRDRNFLEFAILDWIDFF